MSSISTFTCSLNSDAVLETRVLVSRRLEDKNESLGLEHLVLALVSVLKKKVLQFFKTFVVILDASEQGTPWQQKRQETTKAVCHSEAIV